MWTYKEANTINSDGWMPACATISVLLLHVHLQEICRSEHLFITQVAVRKDTMKLQVNAKD
jgi:hypothetical protein